MNVCQRPASDKESAVRSFHMNIRHIALQGEQSGKVGKFGLHQVANVDQTPLPFCFADGPTLETEPFGFEAVDLGWRRGNAPLRLPCSLMARPESSHF